MSIGSGVFLQGAPIARDFLLLQSRVANLTGVPGAHMSQESLVEIRDLNFSYDNRPVLSGINMTIPRGKVVAVMGSSGCGKTTTLRLIGGQLKPTSGEGAAAAKRVTSSSVHVISARFDWYRVAWPIRTFVPIRPRFFAQVSSADSTCMA